MSHSPYFPHEESPSSNQGHIKEGKPQVRRPEFILIDDRHGERKYTHFGSESVDAAQHSFKTEAEEKQAAKGPFSLRFICLLGFIFCLVFGMGMLLWSVVMTCLATFSLFLNPNINRSMRHFWKLLANTFVAGFGFTLGMISPTLGLGLLAIYFSLAGNLVEDDLLRKVIRRSFNRL
jgi:hypothetical protein